MKILRWVGRAFLVGVVFVVAQAIAGWVVPVTLPSVPRPQWWLLATFIGAFTLTAVAMRSTWRGWRLAGAVALLPAAIQLANLAEAAFFLNNPSLAVGRLMLSTVLTFALALPALVAVFGQASSSTPAPAERRPLSAAGMAWRFAACDASYLFLYFLAGLVVISLPYVRTFYEAQGIPRAGQVVAMQLLLRGPVFVGLCVLLMRMLRLPGAKGALAVGLAFTVLSGVVPLLPPNPFFPDAVRWAHFGEVVSSNLVFGSIVGWLWSPRPVRVAPGAGRQEPVPV